MAVPGEAGPGAVVVLVAVAAPLGAVAHPEDGRLAFYFRAGQTKD